MDACNGWTGWRRPTGDRPWAPAHHPGLEPPRYATCHFHRATTTTRRQNSTGHSCRRRTGDPSHPRVPVTLRAGGVGAHRTPGGRIACSGSRSDLAGGARARRRDAITRLYGWSWGWDGGVCAMLMHAAGRRLPFSASGVYRYRALEQDIRYCSSSSGLLDIPGQWAPGMWWVTNGKVLIFFLTTR